VTRERDQEGQLRTEDRLRGVEDAAAFDAEWRAAADARLPRGGGGGGAGGGGRRPLALPAGGGGHQQQQQQWGGGGGGAYAGQQQQWRGY
jgi:hypothetical protein